MQEALKFLSAEMEDFSQTKNTYNFIVIKVVPNCLKMNANSILIIKQRKEALMKIGKMPWVESDLKA